MRTPRFFDRRSTLALFTVALLGVSGSLAMPADPPDSMGSQLSAMAGTGLMLAGCQERMRMLNSMLREAGFNPMRTHLGADGTMTARWYHPERHTTVLAFAGWQATNNFFSATEVPGLMRWNEFIANP
ncbi:hypothetical protein [Deinococcus sonorensis]|uniref:Uncharacterized protein n=1 Tax=Deinococcus sonorensis TaxID=309891 RepID=A0ABV8Y9T5_9DEIO